MSLRRFNGSGEGIWMGGRWCRIGPVPFRDLHAGGKLCNVIPKFYAISEDKSHYVLF